MEWIKDHWGDAASVAGVILSVFAFITAKRAKAAARGAVRKHTLIFLVYNIEQAIDRARKLQETKSAHQPAPRCDELREKIASFQHHPELADHQQNTMRAAVVTLRRPRPNNEFAKVWIRKLIDSLMEIREQLIRTIMELDQ